MAFLQILTLAFAWGAMTTQANGAMYSDCTITASSVVDANAWGTLGNNNPGALQWGFTYQARATISQYEEAYTITMHNQDIYIYNINPSTREKSLFLSKGYEYDNKSYTLTQFFNDYNFVQWDLVSATTSRVTYTCYWGNVYDDFGYTENVYRNAIYNNTSNVVSGYLFRFDNERAINDIGLFFQANSNQGYNQGYYQGIEEGKLSGYKEGYDVGYTNGFNDADMSDETAFTILNGILNVGLLPINVMLDMFNFDVLGINIASFLMSGLTIAMTIIVVRMFLGGKGGGKSD